MQISEPQVIEANSAKRSSRQTSPSVRFFVRTLAEASFASENCNIEIRSYEKQHLKHVF